MKFPAVDWRATSLCFTIHPFRWGWRFWGCCRNGMLCRDVVIGPLSVWFTSGMVPPVLPDRKNGPPSGAFVPAAWRGTTGVNPRTGVEMGLSFNTADKVVRLLLTVESAKNLAESVLEMIDYDHRRRINVQSPTSCGNPSPEVSPQDGVKV